jgi:hypothetical protein
MEQFKTGRSSLITTMGAALKVAANWAKGFSGSEPHADGVASHFAGSGSLDLDFNLNLGVSLHIMATVPSALIGKTTKKDPRSREVNRGSGRTQSNGTSARQHQQSTARRGTSRSEDCRICVQSGRSSVPPPNRLSSKDVCDGRFRTRFHEFSQFPAAPLRYLILIWHLHWLNSLFARDVPIHTIAGEL